MQIAYRSPAETPRPALDAGEQRPFPVPSSRTQRSGDPGSRDAAPRPDPGNVSNRFRVRLRRPGTTGTWGTPRASLSRAPLSMRGGSVSAPRSPGKRSAPGASCSIHRPAQPASHRNNPSRASALQPIRGLGQCSSCWRTLAGERCCRAARPKPCGRPAPPGDSRADCGSLPCKRTASPDFFRGQGPLPQENPGLKSMCVARVSAAHPGPLAPFIARHSRPPTGTTLRAQAPFNRSEASANALPVGGRLRANDAAAPPDRSPVGGRLRRATLYATVGACLASEPLHPTSFAGRARSHR